MLITLTDNDVRALSPAAQAELIALIAPVSGSRAPALDLDESVFEGFDMEGVVDLTFQQIEAWMQSTTSDKTKQGLRVFAEHGPIVSVDLLYAAGIENIDHFRSRTTMRTRTVTGDKNAFMLGWSEDEWEKDGTGRYVSGHYAVTPTTHHALRRYFKLA